MRSWTVLYRHDLASLRRATMWWTIGVLSLGLVNLAFWPSLEGSDAMKAFDDMGPLLEAFGAQGMGTAAGYLDGQMFALMLPMLLAGMTIAAVSGRTAGEEDQGRLEALLALPISRPLVWLGRIMACLTSLLVVAVALGGLVIMSRPVFSLGEVSAASVVTAIAGGVILAAFAAAVTYAAAGAGGSRATAAAIGATALVASYVMAYLVPMVASLQGIRSWSPWHWALGEQPITNGVPAGPAIGVVVITVLLIVTGTVAATRRDVRSA